MTVSLSVYFWYIPHSAVRRQNIAGDDITKYLAQLLRSKGYSFNTSMERNIVRDIKQKHSYIAMNYDEEIDKWESTVGTKTVDIDTKYELPDGSLINLNLERFKCGELLFKPDMFGIDAKNVAELTVDSVMACDVDLRFYLFDNIVLSGGTTLIPGLPERLKAEMVMILESKYGIKNYNKLNVVAPPERKYSTWIGGSILASLDFFQEMWINESEYDEYGANIIHKRSRL